MRNKLSVNLAFLGALVASAPALASHEADYNFPWVQTQSVRNAKIQPREAEHWGKHHHHGIFLEGSDYQHSSTKYD